MASSLQTLIKILRLEEQKGYQNKAVIGGFARFAYHWSREAHSQAKTESHHALVDEIARRLREYEAASEDERPAILEEVIALATGQAQAEEEELPPPPAAPEAAPAPGEGAERRAEEEATVAVGEAVAEAAPIAPPPAPEEVRPSVRERRGYARIQRHPASLEELRELDQPVTALSGVGPSRQEQLERLGVSTIRDLLYLFPRRYDDYTRMKIISQLRPGEEVTVIGVLERITTPRTKNGGTRVEAYLADASGHLRLNWFNQPWMAKQLHEGEPVVVSGRIDQYLGRLVMNAPEMEPIEREWLHTGRIVPVYPLTKGLSGRTLRRLVKQVVDEWAPRLPDPLPLDVRERADLMDYGDAIAQAHFPDSQEDKEDALYRLAFDELFTLHLAMLQQRYRWQSRQGTPLIVEDEWVAAFEEALPYRLTDAQHRAIADIRQDMAADLPMNRLLQGDVGSGKTVVAAIAIGIAVASGVQAALMAPTSILAEQHYASLLDLLRASPLGESVNVALLTGHVSPIEREAIYEGLATGEIQVVVGTHALIQEGVQFAHLGLAVIDEQHRFGVVQRGAL
ncbi:MAG TPA: DEAD/DEAH box helicase, partial [Chloroflexi bacterium]|nr:DEAD/DEAH box helicase [Chloroflexota bacterium]